MGTKGRPKVSEFVKTSIAYKVIQYSKRYNETPYKAWFRLIKHRAFTDLMSEHYKNSKDTEFWVERINENFETKKKFYTKHIKKFIEDFKKNEIKHRLTRGIGSLKS